MQRHGKLLARRADGGRAPHVHDQPLGPVAVILQMLAQQFLGQLHPLGIGRPRGHGPWIGGKQVAPRGPHIAAPAIGGPRRAGGHKPRRQRRDQPVNLARPMIACAKDMQPVAILRFLDVADEAVDAGQRLCRAGAGIKAEVLFNPAALRFGADVRDQPVAPRRVQPVRGRVFIQQPFQPSECIGQFRCHQRGRHMAHGHGPDTAFGLRGLSGVIDDEGIDHRQGAGQRLGPAGVRQGDGFARQPFQRAMGPDMHHRIRLLLQPHIEGDIARARRAA